VPYPVQLNGKNTIMADIRVITDDFSAAPQIALQDLALLAREGYTTVICNRPDGEDPGQLSASSIAAQAAEDGLTFVSIPISGPPSRDQVAAMAKALGDAEGRVLAYCRSGTRSTTLWALASASQGIDAETLIRAAANGGYDLSGHRSVLQQLNEQA
jgi:uncharacterized protein (TIGR01244 family)